MDASSGSDVNAVDGQADRRIVVGVDGSEGSTHALRWALAEAAFGGGTVHAVYAVHTRGTEAEAAVATLVEAARAQAPATVRLEEIVREGHPAEVLRDEVVDADLLVVGSRGRGGFRGLLLGSVSQQCIEHAHVPAVVVSVDAPLPDDGDVVVGVDGSEDSANALVWAAAEAVRRDARLVLVHTWFTPVAVPPAGLVITAIDPSVFRASAEALLSEVAAEVLATVPRQPREVVHRIIEKPAVPGLLASAEDANLLVVGGRGRGGFAGLLLGSVSQQCIRHAPVAVVVVPRVPAERISLREGGGAPPAAGPR